MRVEIRHCIFVAVAALILALGSRINYRFFAWGKLLPWPALILLFIALALGVLVFVPGVGHAMGDRYRWIRIGPDQYSIGLQPSEVIKYSLIIFLSALLSRNEINVRKFSTFLTALAITLVCTGLVITQDFGVGIMICFSALVVMFIAGIPWYYIFSLIVSAAAAAYCIVLNSPAKMQRVMAVVDPWSTSNPSAFQARQAILSILSGGYKGVGPGCGIRKLGFLPEDSTDFIFASFCEEWGLRGAVLLVCLFVLWVWNTRRASRGAGNQFGSTLASSMGIVIGCQAALHIAINLVLLPPTGVALPFVSVGGTSLVMTAIAVAIIASLAMSSDVSDSLETAAE
jgi:cell division protein FtsW